jgi:hypothetical protein
MNRLSVVITIAALLGTGAADAGAAGAARTPARTLAKNKAVTTASDSTRATAAQKPSAADDTTMTMRAGQDGTVFKSLTVQGEDRIHFDVERPALTLDLDPAKAPGLDWGNARDVLDRTVPDLAAPLVARSAGDPSPYVAHPWLGHFNSGTVARFQPDLQGVERWTLTIVNARGEAVAGYQGKGEPPREIDWDGRSKNGTPVVPGLTYSYVLEAHDRAGNKRNFIGQGFQVSAYRLDVAGDPVLVFSGRELPASDPRVAPSSADAPAPIVVEAASWLNQSPHTQSPVRVTATARSADEAQALATMVARQLAPQLLGDPARVMAATEVQPDAPEGGAVRIAIGK